LDRLDFVGMMNAADQPEKMLYLQSITDSIHNYLFFGLGRNGTTAEEFAYAVEYLFQIRANDPKTWEKRRVMVTTAEDEDTGKRSMVKLDLTDEDMIGMCFDTHYEYSGLSLHMPMDRFLTWMVRERRKIVEENMGQILAYLDSLYYEKACSRAKGGHQLPLPLNDRLHSLVQPDNLGEIARLVYLPSKYYSKPKPEIQQPQGHSHGIVKKVHQPDGQMLLSFAAP
jgi:hypothetical protein